MNLNRRSTEPAPTETVGNGLLADLLEDYEATRPPVGVAATGLPAVSRARRPEPVAAPVPPLELRPIAERRGETRAEVRLHVTATHPAGDSAVDGTTVDISLGGMCVVMEGPPPASFVDVAVGEGAGRATVWASVLGGRPVAEGGYQWHLRVLAGDRSWEQLISHIQAAHNRSRLRSVS